MSIKGIYDIHCHIVPGVDDGATDIGETDSGRGRTVYCTGSTLEWWCVCL